MSVWKSFYGISEFNYMIYALIYTITLCFAYFESGCKY